jgi:hypothetical protein
MEKYDHVAFQVSNMDVAIQFYVEKLGFTLSSRAVNTEEGEEYAFLASDCSRAAGGFCISVAAAQHPLVRHEVACVAVVLEQTRYNLLFCQQYPTSTCVPGNGRVRSCWDKVASSDSSVSRPNA